MSEVHTVSYITLTDEERQLMKSAIELCDNIAHECVAGDLFVDADVIFAQIREAQRNGEIPVKIEIQE